MDVIVAEFEEKLPRLRELILACDFVGFDMEFTGLHSAFPPGGQPSLYDYPAEWYQKARRSVQQFTVCQLGLSIFSSENPNKYVAHSYNFFLFPATFGQMDSEFSFQAFSIKFLTHYGFDFNKFLKDGIPYMNEAQEQKLQQGLLCGNWVVHSVLDKDKVKKVINEVTCWVSSAVEGESVVLHDIYGFQMFEIQLILRQALQDIWTVPLGNEEVMVKKISPRDRWLLENTFYDSCRKEQILLSARGFTNLFQTLVKAKKPLVGHNMLMDLLHLHDKFYNPLPEDYEEFKKNIHNLFPILIDTKNVAKAIWKEFQFPQASNLLEVYEVLCSDMNPTNPTCPEVFHASDCLRYATKKSPHEAAYDAFLCGSVGPGSHGLDYDWEAEDKPLPLRDQKWSAGSAFGGGAEIPGVKDCPTPGPPRRKLHVLLKTAHLLFCRISCDPARTSSSFSQYLGVLAAYVNQVNLIRARVQKINFSGTDDCTNRPPLLIANVRGWPGVTAEQIYQELRIHCRFDVQQLRKNQFLLFSNKFKDVKLVLKVYKTHPNLQISLYHHWRHSTQVNCFLQICGIVASWSLLAFLLGSSSSFAL